MEFEFNDATQTACVLSVENSDILTVEQATAINSETTCVLLAEISTKLDELLELLYKEADRKLA